MSVDQDESVNRVQDPSSSSSSSGASHAVQIHITTPPWRYSDSHCRQSVYTTAPPAAATVASTLLIRRLLTRRRRDPAASRYPARGNSRWQRGDGLARRRRRWRGYWNVSVDRGAMYVYAETRRGHEAACSCRSISSDVIHHIQTNAALVDHCRRRTGAIVHIRLWNLLRPPTSRRLECVNRLRPTAARPTCQIDHHDRWQSTRPQVN